jgi:UDP-GlcNAc:undecaprenyl-phosphate GlcNAc-1-phosphate transferase
MFPNVFHPAVLTIIAFVLAVGLTYFVRETAHRFGFVAKPKADRWHKRPTALMGGVAIFLATNLVAAAFVPFSYETLTILCGSAVLFCVGLIDDIVNVKPYQKLFGQLIGAAVIVGGGLQLHWTEIEAVNIAITLFWLIGVTNAVNLLDNMDGLSAGISVIAAGTLATVFYASGQTEMLPLVMVFIGALLGFLVFNFNPASIFMGDSGSLFIGFFLASSVLLSTSGGQSRSLISVLAIPVLTLFIPIFDTTFVTVLRKLWGRRVSQGGRDHTSHRLVALGLSERSAVLMLYALALGAGLLALAVRQMRLEHSIALIGAFVVALTFIGVYLGQVKVYDEQDAEKLSERALHGFLIDLSYKRRIFEIFLDIFLITFCYYAAYGLLFGTIERNGNWEIFIKSLPFLVILKLFAFLATGVYRGIWRYVSVNDFLRFAKGVALGSVLSVLAILLVYRFEGFSRAVFILDALLLLLGLAGSRLAFRFFRQVIPAPVNETGRRVLIFGAGDGGELALREIQNNPNLNYCPVGFVDDNPLKKGNVIRGLRVLGGNGSLPEICRRYRVDEILIAANKISAERLRELRRECEIASVEIKRATFRVEPLEEFFFKYDKNPES